MIKLREQDFMEMRIGTYFTVQNYHSKHEEDQMRERAELVRMQTMMLLNIQLGPLYQIKTPNEFWPLPWEAIEIKPELTPEQEKEQIDKLVNKHKEHHG